MRKSFILLLALGTVILSSYALECPQLEFDLQVPAGESAIYTFQVHNDESITDDIKIYLADWDRDIEGDHRFLEPGLLPRSNTAWISVAPTHFTLKPDETEEVRFTIAVPPDVEGTHWGMIMVEGRPRVEEQAGTAITVVPRFGIKVYETPPGTGRRGGRIIKLQRLGLNPLTFLIGFENIGTVHLTVEGEIRLIGGQGQIVERIPVGGFPILPDAVREVQAVGESSLSPGYYSALAILDYGSLDYLPAGQIAFEVRELQLVPIGDSADPPQDLDGDGLYEDINGDGQFTVEDVAIFGFYIDSPAVQENIRAFDFNNDGVADFDDVVALRSMLEERD